MRVSTRMFQDSALRSVRGSLETLARLQDQAATGRRVNTVSDDPAAATKIMRMEAEIRDLAQFKSNGTGAATRLNTEDTVVTSARDLLEQARKLAISVAGMDPTDPERQATAGAIEQLRRQMVSYGNTRIGGEYIFGGTRTTTPPFQADGTYVGDGSVRQTEIDSGVLIPTNHTGDALFSNALQGLNDLETQLQSGSQASVETAVTSLSVAENEMTASQSETGSRLQQISSTGDDLAKRMASRLDQRDALRDVDPAEASIKVITAQSALERAYAAIGKVLSTNLLDYLQ
jgi:flagellar hook-associated protein 3 FlgL